MSVITLSNYFLINVGFESPETMVKTETKVALELVLNVRHFFSQKDAKCGPHLFNEHSLSACCVPGTAPGTRDTSIKKTEHIPVVKEFVFQLWTKVECHRFSWSHSCLAKLRSASLSHNILVMFS
jgi:hypothetical protein